MYKMIGHKCRKSQIEMHPL